MRFKPQFGDQQISSIQLKENGSETLSVEIDTPATADAKEYPITINARAGAFEASTSVKVSLKGTQDLKMGSLAGTLNTSVTAGTKTPIDFVVGNAGTAPIRNLGFVTKKPSDKWTVEFKPDKIDALDPGEVRQIKMEILAPDRTIAGDYMLTLTANSAGCHQVGGLPRHRVDADDLGLGRLRYRRFGGARTWRSYFSAWVADERGRRNQEFKQALP